MNYVIMFMDCLSRPHRSLLSPGVYTLEAAVRIIEENRGDHRGIGEKQSGWFILPLAEYLADWRSTT